MVPVRYRERVTVRDTAHLTNWVLGDCLGGPAKATFIKFAVLGDFWTNHIEGGGGGL